ncbi:MAG: hypothetical protein ABF780_05715 [Bifidobacterium aquikefiri]|uniref:Uncharacterized protein n=1 Tax=Bifidobacterium aquikefiri TaxID=1653207 RepID=A0A261G278_9BIFI|nr:hypothetical protein [Bifidobacterium aquikefiri]OZG65541.1 hypothetical protein BAQU_1724 [Bifidobacterium aquikefiri]
MVDYAVADDYRTYCGLSAADTVPANLTQLLRAASLAVREYTGTLFYQTDSDGIPVDAILSAAFRDATCAQAQAMDALGIDPAMGGAIQPNTAASKSISGASVSYTTSEQQTAAQLREQVANGLAPIAIRILRASGAMLLTQPWEVG